MPIVEYEKKLLNEFEARSDEWNFADFEHRLSEVQKDASYHDAKSIINHAHSIGKWPNTVQRYLLTTYKVHGNVSFEFSSAFSEVWSCMTDSERKAWGLK